MRQSMRSSSSSLNNSSGSSRGRCIKVVLLNREELTVAVESKAKVQDVFNQVCEHLSLRETEYFGLARLVDDEFQFAEITTKLHKLLHKQPRSWRIQKSDDHQQMLTLYFRVHYYVEHVSLLKERVTRQLYYQQLKDNLLHYSQEVSEEKCFLLAAYSLQADMGNYAQEKHHSQYFDPREYFPAWVVDKRGSDYIRENMPVMHRDCHNMPKQQASMLYIRELSCPPLPHNMHMYRVKRNKQDVPGTDRLVWVAVCPQGVHIYQDEGQFRTLLSTFLWADIGRLHFEKKKFEIQPSGSGELRKFRYYTTNEEHGKYLLRLCQDSHMFQMGMAPKLAEQKQYEAEDRRFRESYIYSDNVENTLGSYSGLSSSGRLVGRLSASKFSISRVATERTSTTSSQTTSGIASERLHTSLDESEETQEILIDSAPQTVDHNCIMHHNAGLSPATSMKACAMTNVSRGSSVHSQHSGAQLTCIPLKAANAHIQKMTFAPSMTVNSQVVMPRMVGGGSGGRGAHSQRHVVSAVMNGLGGALSASSPQIMNTTSSTPTSSTTSQYLQASPSQQYSFISMPPQQQQALPVPHQLQPLSTHIPLQPQYAEPLLHTRSPQQHPHHQHDPTYVNIESLSSALYTQATASNGLGNGIGGVCIGNSPSVMSPGLSIPLTSTPYQSPQDPTVFLPVPGPLQNIPKSHPPPISRTRDFIVNRPNRSYSQVLPPNKVLSPPQRAVSNADAYIAKRPNRVDCPLHGIRPDLFKEIQAKSQRKDTPLLQALCQDRFLQQEQCTCRGQNVDEGMPTTRRFSYSQPSSSTSTPDLYNQPGTIIRPVSWHEPTSLQLFGHSINVDSIEQSHHPDEVQQQLQTNNSQHQVINDSLDYYVHHNHHHNLNLLAEQNHLHLSSQPLQLQGRNNIASLRYHQSMESLDYPTMLTYQEPNTVTFPVSLQSGGRLSGSQSVDNLLQSHNYSLGVVT